MYWADDPRLYELAKRITLEAGMSYTDPRTGKTTHPPKATPKAKPKAKPKQKARKKP